MSSSAKGPDAQWYRHVLYGLAGETFEAQQALDAWESAHAHELAKKIRSSGLDDACPGVDCCQPHGGAADLIDPEKP